MEPEEIKAEMRRALVMGALLSAPFLGLLVAGLALLLGGRP